MAWQEVIAGSNVWVHEYHVPGYHQVNAVAVLLEDQTIAIISPSTETTEADFAAIEAKGRVMALVAPHAGHFLGQAEWQARYPEAYSYAPTAALDRLNASGLRPFAPLSKLQLSPTVEFREVPGTMKGGTLLIVRRGKRPVVYLDELVGNWASLPKQFLARLLFRLTGSAPGLKLNRVYLKLLCTDGQRVAQTVLDVLQDDPAIVLAHGAPLVREGDSMRIQALIAPLI